MVFCKHKLHNCCYVTEVDDTHGRLSFLDGGAILNLPMFYLEGKFCLLNLFIKI